MGIPFNVSPEAIERGAELIRRGIKYGAAVRMLMSEFRAGKDEMEMVLNDVYNTMFSTQVDQSDPWTKSTRKGDQPGKRGRVDGDHALINTVRTKPTRVSLGPSLSFNNSSFLQEMLNRRTSVTGGGGYHFFAEEGKRALHWEHYRHSA